MGTCSVSYLMQEPHPPILPIGSVASAFRSKLGLTLFKWCPFYTGPSFTLQVQLAVTLSSATFSVVRFQGEEIQSTIIVF